MLGVHCVHTLGVTWLHVLHSGSKHALPGRAGREETGRGS